MIRGFKYKKKKIHQLWHPNTYFSKLHSSGKHYWFKPRMCTLKMDASTVEIVKNNFHVLISVGFM